MPERLDLGHLGEEAVAAEVEAPAVAHHGAADAADDVVGLEHQRVLPPFGQQVGRRQPAGPRAGDDDGCVLVRSGHEKGRLVDPPSALVDGRRTGAVRRGRGVRGQGTEMFKKASRA